MSERLEDDKAYIRLFNQNTKLSKRVQDLEDDGYIEKLQREINSLKNDIEMVDQQNLSILKTAEKFKKKSKKLEQQNKRYREALEEIMKIQENHEWNLYGIAYGIAERTLFEVEGEE